LTGVIAISAGGGHTVALKADGTVWAWGANSDGRLGDGTTIDRSLPVRVSGLTGVVAISAGGSHTVALKSDGSVMSWGANYNAQLGDGTTNDQSTAVPVVGLSGVVAISAGEDHTLALRSDASVFAWGPNRFGQLGDGTLADRLAPVVVVRENGAGSIQGNDWFVDLDPGTAKNIPVEKIPVFLLVASGASADVTANLQYRPQDVGTSPNVYVFALAPSSMVKNAVVLPLDKHLGPVARGKSAKDTPLPCVLAQLTSSGQLTAASSSGLQAYLTGVLNSQGQSVSVLNGVSTALLQGAVFYVGYGSSSSSMINTGTNRSVVTIPGTQTCQPQAPQTGWWWNKNEGGRGFSIETQGNNLFMAGYLFDESGRATWTLSGGATTLDGSLYNNTLLNFAGGQSLTGSYRTPTGPTAGGAITLAFTDARNGTLIWPGGSIPIERFDSVLPPLPAGTAPATFAPENGWWWNASESGRGYFLEIKNNFAFIAGYMYDDNGNPLWYLTSGNLSTPQLYQSNWTQFANGQTLTGPFKPATQINANVGAIGIQFQSTTSATLTLPDSRTIPLTRFRF
jgi:hypothetical protein